MFELPFRNRHLTAGRVKAYDREIHDWLAEAFWLCWLLSFPNLTNTPVQLPNLDKAHVPRRKITEYLLAPTHESAQGKAAFFLRCGFRAAAWKAFADALLDHAASFPVAQTKEDPFGILYTVEGPLTTPAGAPTTRSVRSVWIIRRGENFPRLVTSYPIDA